MYETIKIIISKKNCKCNDINLHIHILKQVRASSDIFGDPCKGIIKYLEVEYQCQGMQIM